MSEQATIFIVDDDDAVRDSLKLLLQAYGIVVKDYRSARDFVRAYRPHLGPCAERQCLILDHHLVGETGLDFLESSEGSALPLPVILVTGGGDAMLEQRASRSGVRAYFEKPLNNAALIAKILELVGAPS